MTLFFVWDVLRVGPACRFGNPDMRRFDNMFLYRLENEDDGLTASRTNKKRPATDDATLGATT